MTNGAFLCSIAEAYIRQPYAYNDEELLSLACVLEKRMVCGKKTGWGSTFADEAKAIGVNRVAKERGYGELIDRSLFMIITSYRNAKY